MKDLFKANDKLIAFMEKLMPILLILIIFSSIIGTIILVIERDYKSELVRMIITVSTGVSSLVFCRYCRILKNNPD